MNKTQAGLLLMCLALNVSTPACSNVEQSQPVPDEKAQQIVREIEVEPYIDAWVSLWNSYDLLLVDELFLTDARLSYFSSEREGLIQGIDAVREHHRGFGFVEGGKPAEKKLWVEDMQSEVFGSTAVVTAIWYFGDRSVDRDKVQHGPVTFVYVQQGNDYRLAHLHFANYEIKS